MFEIYLQTQFVLETDLLLFAIFDKAIEVYSQTQGKSLTHENKLDVWPKLNEQNCLN